MTSAITLTGVLANSLVAPALPDIARDLDVSEGGIGLVVAAASLPGVVVAPSSAWPPTAWDGGR